MLFCDSVQDEVQTVICKSTFKLKIMAPFSNLKSAFSAPRICTVDAGYFARLVRLPAWEIRRAPTYNVNQLVSPFPSIFVFFVIYVVVEKQDKFSHA
jgi:hypothetical protein